MTAKEWLGRIRFTEERIKALDAERQRIFEMLTNATGAAAENKVQKTSGNTVNELMTLYAEYSGQIDAQIAGLLADEKEIREAISMVENTTLQTLLIQRYLELKTWERIAEDLELSDYWVRTRLHSRALYEIEKIREQSAL